MTDTPHPSDPDERGTGPLGPTDGGRDGAPDEGHGAGSSQAADAPGADDASDAGAGENSDAGDTLDAEALAVRDLLRQDERGVDPEQRERAVLAALAVADEVLPHATGDGSTTVPTASAAGPIDTAPRQEAPHHPATLVPFSTRRRPGLRVLAVAATIVLVGAGAVVIGGGGDNDESASMGDSSSQDAVAESVQGADGSEAGPDSGGGGAADSSGALEDDDAGGQREQETRSSPTTTSAAATAAPAAPPGTVQLGDQPDVASVLRAAAARSSDEGASRTAPPATGALPTACADAFGDLRAAPFAVATVAGAEVLVVRATEPGAVPLLTALALPGCAVLGTA